MAEEGDAILKVEGLEVRYRDLLAVDQVSFQLQKGSVTALIGANGAGKTTLLKALSGILRPSSGSIVFKGRDLTHASASYAVGQGISLVPQGGRCFSRMSVYDNLLMGSFPYRARRYAAASLERVYGLFPILREKQRDLAGSLSGGQRQMLAIGRALMADPALLIFDEISLGLSPLVVKDIYQCIRRIRQEGVTILLVEQDTRRAMGEADICHVMLKGRIVLSGMPSTLSEETVRQAYFGI